MVSLHGEPGNTARSLVLHSLGDAGSVVSSPIKVEGPRI